MDQAATIKQDVPHSGGYLTRRIMAGQMRLSRNSWQLITLLVVCNLFLITFSTAATRSPQRTRPRPAPPKPQPEPRTPALTPQETLNRVRAASDQQEKIALLERLLAGNPAEPYNQQARELLMREYALKGEQLLREGNPKAALQAFKSAVRAAPAVINDKIFGQYIFPLPLAMSAFGYRTESVELMRSIEPRFE